jgi:hypothetical protein
MVQMFHGSMIFSENRYPLFRIMLGKSTERKDAEYGNE